MRSARCRAHRRTMRKFLIGCTTLATFVLPWSHPFAGKSGGVAWAQAELAVGGNATVIGTEGGGLRLRGGPGLSQPVQGLLTEGSRVQLAEGPQVADGQQWFRVIGAAGSGWA